MRSLSIPGLVALLAIARSSFATTICSNAPNDIIPDGCASYGTLEGLNTKLRPLVQDITQDTDFFSYYRLDLFGRTCPFWSDDEGMCANIACAVTTIDDEDSIPPVWRAEELGKLTGPKAKHPPAGKQAAEPSPLNGALGTEIEESCVVEKDECDDRDYCVPEDESVGSTGDYVSLIENPERFTGYAGAGAENVWKAIYRENCFTKDSGHSDAAKGFAGVLKDKGQHQLSGDGQGNPALEQLDADDECLEKRVFYRLISGMHASISLHLCWDYMNQTTGQWAPNLDCFASRFQEHPERLQNIYFNYAILLRAVAKLRNFLPSYTFCSGDHLQNRLTKSKILKLATAIPEGKAVFDESLMFQDEMYSLKEEFRNRFRNVSRIMDCVGCDKCRLWGKVQTQGYGTALKVLFEFDEAKEFSENPPLRRTELVALINTLDRVSHSLSVIPQFQAMLDARNAAEEDEAVEPKKQNEEEPTFSERFWAEWMLVWKLAYFVIRSWFELPGTLFYIAKDELWRLWQIYYGQEPGARTWSWQSRDIKELVDQHRGRSEL